MKTFKYTFLLLAFLSIVSCDEEGSDDPFFGEGFSEVILGFDSTRESLNILVNESETIDAAITISEPAPTDRTFNISVSDDTTGDLSYFEFPTSVTIPANAYVGNFTITAQDPEGVEVPTQVLVLDLETPDGIVSFDNQLIVTVDILCPVGEEEFVGDYTLTNITAVDFGNLYAEGSTVNITAGEGNGVRMFTAVVLEDLGIGQPATPLVFRLVCESITLPEGQPTNLQCGASLELGGPIGDERGTYITGDDSEFTIVIGYNASGAATCASPSDAVIRLTKN